MITVSLIGVLAAIAIPQFMTYQARARRSEGFTHVAGIARAYKGYHAEAGRFPDNVTEGYPASVPNFVSLGTKKLNWDADAENFFKIVGWRPEGQVYYTYEVRSDGCGGGCTDRTCYTITAHGDVDANGLFGAVMYVHPLRDASGAPIAGASCPSFAGYAVPVNAQTGTDVYDEPAAYQTDPF
jgi:type IV pilus assembly protein PilA